jgi:hypothetical protein
MGVEGTVVPLLTAVIAKEKAPKWVKALINALLAAIAAAITTAIASNGNVDVYSWFLGIGEAWAAAAASYFGLWQPSNVITSIHRATAGYGIGPKEPTSLGLWPDSVVSGATPVPIERWLADEALFFVDQVHLFITELDARAVRDFDTVRDDARSALARLETFLHGV